MKRLNVSTDGKSAWQEMPPPMLYTAALEEITALVDFGESGKKEVSFSGEIALRAAPYENSLLVYDVTSICLWHQPASRRDESIAAAARLEQKHPAYQDKGTLRRVMLRLFYPALARQEPDYVAEDAVFPPLEILSGKLGWRSLGNADQAVLRVSADWTLKYSVLGRVRSLSIPPVDLPLRAVPYPGDQTAANPQAGYFLAGGGGATLTLAKYTLPLRFIYLDFNGAHSDADLQDLVIDQVAGANQVWDPVNGVPGGLAGSSTGAPPGALNVTVQPFSNNPANTLAPSVNGNVWIKRGAAQSSFPMSQEANIPGISGAPALSAAVDVYLVDALLGDQNNPDWFHQRPSGGVTYNCSTQNAYIILDARKAAHNRFLLAHEIGHVLGLRHPLSVGTDQDLNSIGTASYGSECSVMVPDRPCSHQNTFSNLDVIWEYPVKNKLTGPVSVMRPALAPQNFYQMVRDFPEDDGSVPSIPRPPVQLWTQSDVWNSTKVPQPGSANFFEEYAGSRPLARDLMFDEDNAPLIDASFDPAYSVTNHMLVRLHLCQQMQASSDVRVHLLLAIPGMSTSSIKLLTPAPAVSPLSSPAPVFDGGLVFNLAATPNDDPYLQVSLPVTLSQDWTIGGAGSQVPANYGPDCCVFAVAVSSDDLSSSLSLGQLIYEIGQGIPHTFYDLFTQLSTADNVAQRNLHIQQTGGARPTPLPFMALANPTGVTGPLDLEVHIPASTFLSAVRLEIDGEVKRALEPGDHTLRLWDTFRASDAHDLRLHADLRDARAGDPMVPVELVFLIDNQVISGYTHTLNAASPGEVAFQVIDRLYGALLATGEAFGRDCTEALAGGVLEILKDARGEPDRTLESLAGLSGAVDELARNVYGMGSIPAQDLGDLLGQLSSRLRADRADVFDHLEKIRDLADLIHHGAGKVARG